MEKYITWKTRRYVVHNTETGEIIETDALRWIVSIIREHEKGFSRAELWELVEFAIHHGVPVSMGCVVFVDTQA